MLKIMDARSTRFGTKSRERMRLPDPGQTPHTYNATAEPNLLRISKDGSIAS